MFKRNSFRKVAVAAALALAVAVIVFAWLTGRDGTDRAPVPNEAEPSLERLTFTRTVPDDRKRVDETGKMWVEAAVGERYALDFEAASGVVRIREKNGGFRWSSIPSDELLSADPTKGTWSHILRSPFSFRYIQETGINEKLSSPAGEKAVVHWRLIDKGVGILYEMKEAGFRIYMEYALEADGFRVSVPRYGIAEEKENRLTSLDVLPFFFAASQGQEGYLLVPDGPGGLISFNANRIPRPLPYRTMVYGNDPAVDLFDPAEAARGSSSFPVFGMKADDDGFMAIIEDGQFNANIVASPAGLSANFHRVHVNFPLRRLYDRPISLAETVKSFEDELFARDLSVKYVLMEHGKADYVAMAGQYRSYLTDTQHASPIKGDAPEPPLIVQFAMGAGQSTPFGERFVAATTFGQAAEIAQSLKGKGVSNLRVGLSGWNQGGLPGKQPDSFPFESKLGGAEGFDRMRTALEAEGIEVFLFDPTMLGVDRRWGGFPASREGIYGIGGSLVKFNFFEDGPMMHLINPKVLSSRYFPSALNGYGKHRVPGVWFGGLGDWVYSDFRKNNRVSREETGTLFLELLKEARQRLAYIGSGANAYAIGTVDHMFDMPLTGEGHLIVDKTVPFYPIAIHGLLTYSSTAGNQRYDAVRDLLRQIEYGALPNYWVTEENSSVLKRTEFDYIYQSEYSVLEQQIVEEYETMKTVFGGSWESEIVDHRQVADDVFETVYDNGRTVWVSYSETSVSAEGHDIAPLSFKVVSEGESE